MSRNGSVFRTGTNWVASYQGVRVMYSESRFGYAAQLLATRALAKMKDGEEVSQLEDVLLRASWRMQDAAPQLQMTVGQLRQWMLTGFYNGIEIRPPLRAPQGADRITGCELILARERLIQAQTKSK